MPNFSSSHSSVGSMGRLNSQYIMPSVKKFLQRSTSFLPRGEPASASIVRWLMSSWMTRKPDSEPSVSGLVLQSARSRSFSVKDPVFTRTMPPGLRSL